MSQLEKNTVKSNEQLDDSDYVLFDYPQNNGKRFMFVGNSITLHSIAESIGWHNRCGMAASSVENDYVHICEKELLEKYPDASFCICQVCEWESSYKKGSDELYRYENARNFNPDVIIMRAVENCSYKDFDKNIFLTEYDKLISYLNFSGKAKIILTTSFWKHPADEAITEYAKNNFLPLCELGDLGELDEMKAIGKFKHSGVAQHPSDKGMRAIAKRILKEFERLSLM